MNLIFMTNLLRRRVERLADRIGSTDQAWRTFGFPPMRTSYTIGWRIQCEFMPRCNRPSEAWRARNPDEAKRQNREAQARKRAQGRRLKRAAKLADLQDTATAEEN